jgi:Zn-dependent protease with chaperone function
MSQTNTVLLGHYLDGKSARAADARLRWHDEQWQVSIEDLAWQSYGSQDVVVEEAIKFAPRRLRFPDGAVLEIHDANGFEALLHSAGVQRTWVDRAQNSWRIAIGALIVSAIAVGVAYGWALPWFAATVAQHIPASVERSLGDQAWATMDKQMFAPSALPPERQKAISDTFARLQEPGLPTTQLLFRSIQGGANAFALPGGRLILTDQMVQLADQIGNTSTLALAGVLAHEMGHVAHRHSLRQIVQAMAITGLVSLWLGDVNTLVAGLPAMVLEMKYSRDFEIEADEFGISLMQRQGLDTRPTGRLFELLLKQEGGTGPTILSSHPPTAERAKRYNSGQQN